MTKNIVTVEKNEKTPTEQINVYTLSHSFVTKYGAYNQITMSKTQTNNELDIAVAQYEYKVGLDGILNITI